MVHITIKNNENEGIMSVNDFSTETKKKKNIFREYGEALLIALGLAVFIRIFFVSAFTIPSGSMLETIQIGDFILVNKMSYGTKIPFFDAWVYKGDGPEHGDIIVFKYPKDPSIDYIKRVVGVPGDVIEVKDTVLYRNGVAIKEDYIRFSHPNYASRLDNMAPFTVPEDEYFTMGDNRDNSEDSRVWGSVHRNAIYGKAWRIYWSWDAQNSRPRFSRLTQLVE